MRIARLELHGFKSFADRTVFHFAGGISCVVGPNGCGKSNVVDALKWVIGEMSARSLRGEDMLDVIFAGSADRKPVGYAEVALTLSAEGGEPFPGEYARFSEIQLARRLYRDGTAEYLVNQTKARRKDIVDLIMDSGVGNHLYSFIEQGRIDKIVSASPEERRSLIDEAAGITRYKLRRHEARQKLEATAGQLDRAADVADEMGRRLATLEKQVVKAARFRRLRALVRQEEIFLALVKFRDLSSTKGDAESRLDELRATVASLEAQVAGLEEDGVLRAGELDVAQAAVGLARDQVAELDARRRETDAARALQERRRDEISVQLDAARSDLDAEHARRATAEAQHEAASAELIEVEEASMAAEDAILELRERSTGADAARDAAREQARSAELDAGRVSADLRELSVRREALDAQLREGPERLVRLDERLRAADDEAIVLHKRIAVAEQALEERQALVATVDAELEARQDVQGEAERKDLHARDAVGRAEAELDAVTKAWTEAVTQADGATARADQEVAQVVAMMQSQADARRKQLEREHGAQLQAAELSARKAVADAQARGRQWIEAARRQADAEVRAWRRTQDQTLEAEDTRWQHAIEAARRDAATAVARAEDEARAEAEAHIAAATERRDAAEQAVQVAKSAVTAADGALATSRKALAEADARLGALKAADEAAGARDAGAVALRKALGELPRLIDLLPADPEHARLLGRRLLLPVVRSEDHLRRALAAVGRAPVELVWWPDGAGPEAVTGPLVPCESLEDALAAAPGAIRVVRATGVRVEPGGVVVVPGDDDQAAAAIRRKAELATLHDRRVELDEAVRAAEAQVQQSRRALEAAQTASRTASEHLGATERTWRDRVRAAQGEARQAADEAPRRLTAEWQAWRGPARAAVERDVAAREQATEQAATGWNAAVDEAVDAVRAEQDAIIEGVRATHREAREQLDAEARRQVDAARAAAQERARATASEVFARRDGLRGEVDRLSRVVSTARERATATGHAVQEARTAVERVQRERGDHERVIARIEAEADGARQAQVALGERVRALRDDRERLRAQVEAWSAHQEELVLRIEELQGRADAAEERMERTRAASARLESEASRARQERERAEATAANLRERRVRLDAMVRGAAQQQGDAAARIDATTRRLGELAARLDEVQEALVEASRALDALGSARQEAATALDAARRQEEEVRRERDRVSAELHQGSLRLERVRRELLDAERVQRQAGGDLESVVQRIEERYQISLAHALAHLEAHSGLILEAPDEVRDGLEIGGKKVDPVEDMVIRPEMMDDEGFVKLVVGRIEDHREELGRIGDVNLTALDEYTELKARHDELEGQRQDLESSVDAIRQAIAKMNKTCRERFRETFDRVDEEFRTAYPNLVGGGEARLELTNEEDLLETGVEIYVRPPGKRLQTLSLLSGGEKAMTAIALLLALFTVKPSPFCVLDEVDAPLDEANGARFNDMLGKMSTMTQFIVITHNRKTMECADTLYGITMPTPGCSALVSVQID